jgi:hypothetical protein
MLELEAEAEAAVEMLVVQVVYRETQTEEPLLLMVLLVRDVS